MPTEGVMISNGPSDSVRDRDCGRKGEECLVFQSKKKKTDSNKKQNYELIMNDYVDSQLTYKH